MMHSPKSALNAALGIITVAAAVLLATPARAEEFFPAKIQADSNMACVPGCVLCHGKAVGDATSWPNKPFGLFMGTHGAMKGQPDSITMAYNAYVAAESTTPAGMAKVAQLQQGIDPDTGNSLCGPSYGCGAHVAKKAPPSDFQAPLWIVGAMVVGGILRRRKNAA